MFNDIGKFVGRYLQVFACLSIASMILSPIFFDSLIIDPTFILLFWAASHLIRHHPTARKWMIGVLGFILVGITALFVYAAIVGTQNMTVTVGRRIENPTLWHVSAIAILWAILAAFPLILLLTPQAKREFQQPSGA